MNEADFKINQTWGEIIEDRGSQIIYSALGQEAPLAEKKKWDADINKGYGIKKLRDTLDIPIQEMIFVGDALFSGSNDYPAKEAGVTSIQVRDLEDTKKVIETLIACLEK
jgi:hypothetical protein